jgi:hypothetical protein
MSKQILHLKTTVRLFIFLQNVSIVPSDQHHVANTST